MQRFTLERGAQTSDELWLPVHGETRQIGNRGGWVGARPPPGEARKPPSAPGVAGGDRDEVALQRAFDLYLRAEVRIAAQRYPLDLELGQHRADG